MKGYLLIYPEFLQSHFLPVFGGEQWRVSFSYFFISGRSVHQRISVSKVNMFCTAVSFMRNTSFIAEFVSLSQDSIVEKRIHRKGRKWFFGPSPNVEHVDAPNLSKSFELMRLMPTLASKVLSDLLYNELRDQVS